MNNQDEHNIKNQYKKIHTFKPLSEKDFKEDFQNNLKGSINENKDSKDNNVNKEKFVSLTNENEVLLKSKYIVLDFNNIPS